jgi:hypothetical protein
MEIHYQQILGVVNYDSYYLEVIYIYITKNLGVFNYDSYSYLEDLEVQFH